MSNNYMDEIQRLREVYEEEIEKARRSAMAQSVQRVPRHPWINSSLLGNNGASNRYLQGQWSGADVEDVATQEPESPFKSILGKLKQAEPRKVEKKHRMPDLTTVIVAWRSWAVFGDKLKALGQNTLWEPKKAIQAICLSVTAKHTGKDFPYSNCNCGIWAFKTLDILIEAIKSYREVAVIGKVSLWGKVIETENGYRAQYAYPAELWLKSEEQEELGLLYDVPVRTAK